MKEYKIKFDLSIKNNLLQIINFLSQFDYNLPIKFLSNFYIAVNSLKYFPNRNQKLEILINCRRIFFYKHYMIIYSVDNINNIVYIKYIFSTKQNYNKIIP